MLNLVMPILAQAAGTAAPSGGGGMGSPYFLLWIIAIFAIIYFMMIRPQKKKDKQRKQMLDEIKRGDEVVTIGGIHGQVESLKDDYVILTVDRASGHTLKFRRGAIHEILPKDSGSSEDPQQ